ncbi:hypothetical protein SLE2022_242020 [Rubroshorea leprosula]
MVTEAGEDWVIGEKRARKCGPDRGEIGKWRGVSLQKNPARVPADLKRRRFACGSRRESRMASASEKIILLSYQKKPPPNIAEVVFQTIP